MDKTFRDDLIAARAAVKKRLSHYNNPALEKNRNDIDQWVHEVLDDLQKRLQNPHETALRTLNSTLVFNGQFLPVAVESIRYSKPYRRFSKALGLLSEDFVLTLKQAPTGNAVITLTHPTLTRAQLRDPEEALSPYAQLLKGKTIAARKDYAERLRGDRHYIRSFNGLVADFAGELRQRLVASYAATGDIKAVLEISAPYYVAYEGSWLARLPAYRDVVAAAKVLDPRFTVQAGEKSGGMGNHSLTITVALPSGCYTL